jgi:dihydroxy-acid dehydratase
MSKFDKSKLPSRHVSVGPERAPHRSYYYAMGMTEEEINRPFVAVASAGNDSAPCNTALDAQANICRTGVIEAGGTPRRFNTITVTDGIAMGHQGMKSSLVSREVIADSVELSVRGHCYDALVGFAGCDKSLPGMMMSMLRLNVPSIFVYGGSILPGRFHDKDVTVAIARWRSSLHWKKSLAPATVPAAASSLPTLWPVWARQSDYRCQTAIWPLHLINHVKKSRWLRASK